MSYSLDWEGGFCHCFSSFLEDASAYVASVRCAFLEFANERVHWEAICYYLDEASFIFGSYIGEFQVFADGRSAAGFSY